MDNVTHSLLGILAAEPLALSRRREHRASLWVASAVANNLPDLDVLFTWGRHYDRLNYMLHHRGFTHTLLLAPLQSLLWLAILRLWWRRRSDIPWRAVTALCLLGPWLHIFADAWNSYGVHPFWPFDNRWYYGDLVFIVEPWIWAILLPLIFRRCATWLGSGLALLLSAFMVGLVWYHPYVAAPTALALTAGYALWFLAQWGLAERARVIGAFALLAAMFGSFAWAELGLKRAFAADPGGAGETEKPREIAALASPGNPFCWTVLTAGFRGATYRAEAWTAAPLPSLVPASACKRFLRAPLPPLDAPATTARIPLGVFEGTRAEYDSIVKGCRARAFLRFARIPYWKLEGKHPMLGDLRFDRGFSFSLPAPDAPPAPGGEPCPKLEPPWVAPFHPSALAP